MKLKLYSMLLFLGAGTFLRAAQQACQFQPPTQAQVEADMRNEAARGTLDAQKLNFYLQWGARIDARNAQGQAALDLALDNNHSSVVELLLQRQTAPSIQNTPPPLPKTPKPRLIKKPSALVLERSSWSKQAAQKANESPIGDSLRIPDKSTPSPSPSSAKAAKLLGIKDDIAHKALNHAGHTRQKSSGPISAEVAIEAKNFEVAFSLVERLSIDEINSATSSGSTLLIAAIQSGNKELVEIILKKGAHINTPDHQGMTPLMVAARSGNKGIVKLLISRNANLDAQDRFGWTALMWAEKEDHSSLVRELLKAGAKPEIRSYNTKTIIDILHEDNDKLPENKRLPQRELEVEARRWVGLTHEDIKKMHMDFLREHSWANKLFGRAPTNRQSAQTHLTVNNDESATPLQIQLTSPQGSSQGIRLSPSQSPIVGSPQKITKIFGADIPLLELSQSHKKTNSLGALSAPSSPLSHARTASTPSMFIIPGSATDFMRLIDDNNIDFVKSYLDHKLVDINAPVPGYHGQSPFYRAVEKKRADIIELMADHEPNFSIKNMVTGKTPLDLIRENAAESIMRCITDYTDDDITSAIWYIKNGLVDCTKPVPLYGKSPRDYARELNRTEILASISRSPSSSPRPTLDVEESPSPRPSPSHKKSPSLQVPLPSEEPKPFALFEDETNLMQFIDTNKSIDFIQKYIDYYAADINAPVSGYHEQTPLYRAVEQNRTEIAKMLLERGANFTHINELTGKSPLDRALELPNRTGIASAMIEKLGKSKIDMKNERGETMLYRAVKYDNEDTVKFLLKRGASPALTSTKGLTPLMLAAASCNQPVLKLLIQYKAPLDTQDQYGFTALMWAAKQGKDNCVHALIEAKARADIKSFSSKTIADILLNENDQLPEEERLSEEVLKEEAAQWADKTFLTINPDFQRRSIFESMVKNWNKH